MVEFDGYAHWQLITVCHVGEIITLILNFNENKKNIFLIWWNLIGWLCKENLIWQCTDF